MRLALASSLLLVLSSLGCGSDGGDTDASSTGPGSGGAGSGGSGGGSTEVPCDGAPAELALEGTWAAKGRLSVTLQGTPDGAVTLCPENQQGEATILLMVTVKQDPSDPTKLTEVDAALCDIALPIVTAKVGECMAGDTNLVSTELIAPAALIDSLPNVPTDPATGTLAGTAPGAGLDVTGLKVTVGSTTSGAAMASWDVADDACNGDMIGRTNQCEATCVSDCASLRDDDGDGYPGVTVHVCGYTSDEEASACKPETPSQTGVSVQGRGFINIEVAPTLTGKADSSCELTGTIDTPILYNLVGADVYLGPGPIGVTSAIKSLPTFDVDPAASKFRMVRVDGQYGAPDWEIDAAQVGAACKTIIGRVNEL